MMLGAMFTVERVGWGERVAGAENYRLKVGHLVETPARSALAHSRWGTKPPHSATEVGWGVADFVARVNYSTLLLPSRRHGSMDQASAP